MRQLEVVAVSDDGTQVLLASAQDAAKPSHWVRIDGRLNAAVRGTLNDAARRESELSPKEIQARLRAGEPAEQVAKLAKVPIARVMRYAGPVISERERIVDQARAAVLHRGREETTGVPLGLMVQKRLAQTAGLREDTVSWTARRRSDGAWVVGLTYAARGGARTASWLWQPNGRALSSLNALATRLGADEPVASARRRRAAGSAARPRPAAKRAASTRTAGSRSTANKAPAKRAAATKAAPAARRAPATERAAAAKRATPAKRAATGAQSQANAAATPTTPAKSKNGRVAVPSWSDVLIGVQAPAAARGVRPRSAARGRRRS